MALPRIIEKNIQADRENELAKVWADLDALPARRESGVLSYHLRYSIKAVVSAPFTFIASILTGTVAFFVCALGVLVIENINRAALLESSELILTMYLNDSVTNERALQLMSNMTLDARVDSAEYVPRSEALLRLKNMLGGDSLLLTGLEEDSPLPTSIELKFKQGKSSIQTFKEYEDLYSESLEFERIEYNRSWLTYLNQINQFVGKWGILIVGVLITISAFVVFNTTKLSLYAHRKEIEIMKLLGARDAFIRAPYVLEGMFQGFLSGAFGVGFLWLSFEFGFPYLKNSELLNTIVGTVNFLTKEAIFSILGISTLIGAFSSLLGTRKVGNA